MKIKISPEKIKSLINDIDYNGKNIGVYSGMSNILSGNTGNTSLLTGLTINVFLKQDIKDIGYYTPFDGVINQKDSVSNFIFTSDEDEPYTYYIYNTSKIENKFTEESTYEIDWGDGSEKQNITNNFNAIPHLYPQDDKTYVITLKQSNSFGDNIIKKKVKVPYSIVDITNKNGTFTFQNANGNWSGTPKTYDYIFSGDSENNVQSQITNLNILISGVTKSRLSELSSYGLNEYQVGVPIIKYGDIFGIVDDIGDSITGYTIQGVKYFDYIEGVTVYVSPSSGITSDMIIANPITKEEHMLHVVSQVEIQTNVFIERGKNSAYEKVQRIGEIRNITEMENYGRGFFNLINKP